MNVKQLYFIVLSLLMAGNILAQKGKTDDGQPVLIRCGDNGTDPVMLFQNGVADHFTCDTQKKRNSKNVTGYTYSFISKSEDARKAVGVEYVFENWSVDNYVMVPAAAYNGNRFDCYPVPYPPMFYDQAYQRVDLPVTITDVPRLNIGAGKSKMDLETGSCTTPAVCLFFKKEKKGILFLTTQESALGNNGITIEESDDRKTVTVRFSAPEIRETFYAGCLLEKRVPKGRDWHQDDRVEIRIQRHDFECKDIPEMFAYYARHRKDLTGKNSYRNLTPYSTAYRMVTRVQDSLRWYQDDQWEYYKTGNGDSPFGHIQIGFCGEIVKQYPMLWSGNPLSIDRCAKTFNIIFGRMQGASGLLYGIFKKGELLGDNFNEMITRRDWVLIRKNCDALGYMVKNLMLMKQRGITINPLWENGTRQLADAFVTLWERYGQFGQYVNPVTGDIIVGGSTAGAYAPCGLALAYIYFGDQKYLEIAKASAVMYYSRDVKVGYTTGHAAEVLQSPDADSAYALLASFVTVAEVSGDDRFWKMAKDMANLFSSWVVSYDYRFPPGTVLDKCKARTAGAVWASVQNKHAAPGICQYSGDALLKLYRKTNDSIYLNLIKDISHNLLEFMSTETRPVGLDKDGAICERVQMSDWEGNVGYASHYYNAWVEEAIMLTTMEIPGIYIQTDKEKITVFDHVDARIVGKNDNRLIIEISNPTLYDAQVSLLAENSALQKKVLGELHFMHYPKVKVASGEKIQLVLGKDSKTERPDINITHIH